MRIYIIGNDGITLSREAPATVNDGEVAVASKAELHAAPLSGKRLLALWNALPGVERRRTVGDRKALIDRLWPAIEALPNPELEPDAKRPSKQDEVIAVTDRAHPAGSIRRSECRAARPWPRIRAAPARCVDAALNSGKSPASRASEPPCLHRAQLPRTVHPQVDTLPHSALHDLGTMLGRRLAPIELRAARGCRHRAR